ncbi:subtilisin inhibitor, partial [Gilbertella persicaria]|uniref:subtilisin inhibitor n=1 Tax=Gilbertella persicaria TaxID=101096 RepID=UPI00221E874D
LYHCLCSFCLLVICSSSTFPLAYSTCAQLAAVNGNITQIPPTAGVACTLQYDPVSVTVLGTYGGRGISFQQTYGNSCTMGIALGDFL